MTLDITEPTLAGDYEPPQHSGTAVYTPKDIHDYASPTEDEAALAAQDESLGTAAHFNSGWQTPTEGHNLIGQRLAEFNTAP